MGFESAAAGSSHSLKSLGAVREAIPIYGSGGFTSYGANDCETQLEGWVEKEFLGQNESGP